MPASKRYVNDNPLGSATKLRVVTPHATEELEFVTAALIPSADGTIAVVAADDTDPVTVTVKAGVPLMVRAKAVRVTGTSAGTIVALIN